MCAGNAGMGGTGGGASPPFPTGGVRGTKGEGDDLEERRSVTDLERPRVRKPHRLGRLGSFGDGVFGLSTLLDPLSVALGVNKSCRTGYQY